MLREVIAFANFQFSLGAVKSRVLDGERIHTEERKLLNWREYQACLESLGLDDDWDGRGFWSRYLTPRADSAFFDELRGFQNEIIELLESIAERRIIPGSYWRKIFRESDGLPLFVKLEAAELAVYGPEDLKKADFPCFFQAETYRAFMMGLLRQLIISGRIFDVGKNENGFFIAGAGGERAASRGNSAALAGSKPPEGTTARARPLSPPIGPGPGRNEPEGLFPEGGAAAEGGRVRLETIGRLSGPEGFPVSGAAEVWPAGSCSALPESGGGAAALPEAPPAGGPPLETGPAAALAAENESGAAAGPALLLTAPSYKALPAATGPAGLEAPLTGAAPRPWSEARFQEAGLAGEKKALEPPPLKKSNRPRIPIEYIVDNLDRLKNFKGG